STWFFLHLPGPLTILYTIPQITLTYYIAAALYSR
ncbi:MAG: hypothetical protein ACI90V_008862, partial [Bacillariaceae sp.]